MPDQADQLRARMRVDPVASGPAGACRPEVSARCRMLAVTGGKGGVGTSVLTLNLAIALGETGRRVVVVDADLGAANIDLLCDLAPRLDLGDALAGSCTLLDAAIPGPCGVRVVAGAHAARTPPGRLTNVAERLRAEVVRLRAQAEGAADFVLIDAGSGLKSMTAALAALADEVLVVAGPEPSAVADTHAALGRLGRLPPAPVVRMVVNQASSRREGGAVLDRLVRATRQFQGLVVDPLGSVRVDPAVGRAVRARRPFVRAGWSGRAARDVRRLARALLDRAEVARDARSGGILPVWLRSRAGASSTMN